MTRTRRNNYLYSSDDCKCCIGCCMPAIGLSMVFENLLKCICCCPCYTEIYCEKTKTKKSVNPIPPIPPVVIAVPIDDKISERYFGKIWGINN